MIRFDVNYAARSGAIAADPRFDGDKVHGTVTVPEGVSAEFKWRGLVRRFTTGPNARGL